MNYQRFSITQSQKFMNIGLEATRKVLSENQMQVTENSQLIAVN